MKIGKAIITVLTVVASLITIYSGLVWIQSCSRSEALPISPQTTYPGQPQLPESPNESVPFDARIWVNGETFRFGQAIEIFLHIARDSDVAIVLKTDSDVILQLFNGEVASGTHSLAALLSDAGDETHRLVAGPPEGTGWLYMTAVNAEGEIARASASFRVAQ